MKTMSTIAFVLCMGAACVDMLADDYLAAIFCLLLALVNLFTVEISDGRD